jgi:phenylacetate-CoA ligase
MIYNEKIECMSRDEMHNLQSKKLAETVNRVYKNVPFYKDKMDKAGIKPEDIKSIDDISKLPFTTKKDLRDNYPFGLFAAKQEDIVRIHASSGTTGKPTVVGYTKKDIENWAEVCARTIALAGGHKGSTVQVAYGYGLFTGGLGMHYGGEKLGASVVPMSSGNTKKQLMLMEDFGTTILCCTPSYALYLAEAIEEMGIDRSKLKLKSGIFGAEPWSEQMRTQIEDRLKIKARDIYGLSEIVGPGVSCDCEYKTGLHINEDYFYPEIIDPDSLKQIGYDKKGELVFTCIEKEGIPLLRYRTKDISSLSNDECGCGRTLVRMQKVMGRSDDMLIIRGVNVFPSQIESVLVNFADVEPHYQIIVERKENFDTLEIQVEVSEKMFSDEVRRLEMLRNNIKAEMQSVLGISVDIKFVEPKTIVRSMGKAVRVIDNRKI